MPNWVDDEGRNWFGVLECKRCLQRFDAVEGEVPPHRCVNEELYESRSSSGEYHVPVPVRAARVRPRGGLAQEGESDEQCPRCPRFVSDLADDPCCDIDCPYPEGGSDG